MTTQLGAILTGNLPFTLPLFIICTTLVIAWAVYLPTTVRDADRRKLAPNVPARILFLVIYVLVFAALVTAFAFGGRKMLDYVEVGETSYWHLIYKSFEGQAPLLAVTVLTFLHSIAYFRDLEHAFIIWLHSALYLKGDIQTLKAHLKKCSFDPTSGERDKNILYLRDFDVYVDEGEVSALQLEAVVAWRKTSTLIRLVRQWNPDRGHILDDRDMALLDEIEKAHARKTRLAMNIIRMIRQKEMGARSAEVVTNLALALANASHRDRSEVAEIEGRIRSALSNDGSAPAEGAPLHLTPNELQQHLAQIESYFRVEYSLLLQQASELAAKSVVLAGDEAPGRLEQLKAVGFGQLGRVEAINFDRVVWVFFAILLLSFLTFFFFPRPADSRIPFSPVLMAQIAFVTALATLIGAIIGSNRKLAAKVHPPWTAYVAAGLIAIGGFVAVHGTSFLIKNLAEYQSLPATTGAAETGAKPAASTTIVEATQPSATPAIPAASAPQIVPAQAAPIDFKLRHMMPWAATPFFLAIAICWLARQTHWPRPPNIPASIWERSIDGFILLAVMMFAQATALALHFSFDTPFAGIIKERMVESGASSPLFVVWRPNPGMLTGFLIGYLIVRDVRVAAHAQLTDTVALEAYLASERLGNAQPPVANPPGYPQSAPLPSAALLPRASGT